MPISVAIVEDQAGFADEVKRLLNQSDGFACVAVCQSAEDALKELPALRPEVVLMDINLPGASGVDCVRRLKDELPDTEISMFTVFDDHERITQSIFAGASGYLLKGSPPADLLNAIREVRDGGSPMTPSIARKVIAAFRQFGPGQSDAEMLTLREREVLSELGKGRRYKEVGDELGISYGTVRSHVQHIYKKLHVRTRAQALKQVRVSS